MVHNTVLLTFIAFGKTLLLRLDQSDDVVACAGYEPLLRYGSSLERSVRQILDVLLLRFDFFHGGRVPPGASVLRQGFEQRGEDGAIGVRAQVAPGVRAAHGRSSRRRAAATDQKQEQHSAKTTKNN